MKKYVKEMVFNGKAGKKEIYNVECKFGISFPEDYKEFMEETDGGEGNIGELSYISIWKIEDIVELNISYEVKKYTPNLVYFGSDGGDMAYAFEFSRGECTYIEFPFMSIKEDDKQILGYSFEEFLKVLYERH